MNMEMPRPFLLAAILLLYSASAGADAPNIVVTDSVAPYGDHNMTFATAAPGQRVIQTVTISNTGNADLLLDPDTQGRTLKSPFFIPRDTFEDGTCRGYYSLPPSTSCFLSIAFAPTSIGDFSSSLEIASNDSDTPVVSISVSGTSQSQHGAALYTIQDLSVAGYLNYANSINDAGEIAGSRCIDAPYPNNVCRAIRWSPGGAVQDLGTLGGIGSSASKINNAGQILGSSTDVAGQSHQFLWTSTIGMINLASVTGIDAHFDDMNDVGQFIWSVYVSDEEGAHAHVWSLATGDIDIGRPIGTYSSIASAINNRGQVLGSGDGYQSQAWIRNPDGNFTMLGHLGNGFASWPRDLSDSGIAVGQAQVVFDGAQSHAFRWSASTGMQDLTPNLYISWAGVVNTRGDALGGAQDGQFWEYQDSTASLLWTSEGEIYNLDGLVADMSGWQHLDNGRDINNRGQIVGSGITASGARHPFLLTPILPDADADEFPDLYDNCVAISNSDQLDADGDGYGNKCDADLNNSGLVTATDFNLLRSCLNQLPSFSPLCAAADINGSGRVTATDFNLMRARMNLPPGPSGLHP